MISDVDSYRAAIWSVIGMAATRLLLGNVIDQMIGHADLEGPVGWMRMRSLIVALQGAVSEVKHRSGVQLTELHTPSSLPFFPTRSLAR